MYTFVFETKKLNCNKHCVSRHRLGVAENIVRVDRHVHSTLRLAVIFYGRKGLGTRSPQSSDSVWSWFVYFTLWCKALHVQFRIKFLSFVILLRIMRAKRLNVS